MLFLMFVFVGGMIVVRFFIHRQYLFSFNMNLFLQVLVAFIYQPAF